MLLHLIYVIVIFSCLYTGNSLRFVRDTHDIPTHKFKPIRTDDNEWSIHQRSSSSFHGFSDDNREFRSEGIVYERGSGPNSSYVSIQLPEPHVVSFAASSDSDTTLRYDSWEVTTPSTMNDEKAGIFNSRRNPVNSRRRIPSTLDSRLSPFPMRHIEDADLITAENFRRFMLRSNPNHIYFSKHY